MLTACLPTFTGSAEGGGGGRKLTRRVIANRQSAQRSRLRKLQYIADLESNIGGLQDQVAQLGPKLTFLKAQHAGARLLMLLNFYS